MRYLATALLTLVAGTTAAAPDADLWKRWQQHNENSEQTIDHSAWTAFLDRYVVEDGPADLNRLRYQAVSDADHKALRDYIQHLSEIGIGDYSRPVQRAFWINLYNAVTVNLVLTNDAVDSIRDIGGGLLGSGPWNDELVSVAGIELTLNDIEHRILRPIWDDGLTHYGVNCASVGCPNLLTEAFTGDNITRMLRDNARAYVNSRRGVRFEDDGKLTVSRIYKWYTQDFGGSEAGVITHLRQFAKPELSARLDAAEGIDAYAYEWSLNDAGE